MQYGKNKFLLGTGGMINFLDPLVYQLKNSEFNSVFEFAERLSILAKEYYDPTKNAVGAFIIGAYEKINHLDTAVQ